MEAIRPCLWGWSNSPRSRFPVKSHVKCVFVYMRGQPKRDPTIANAKCHLGRLEIFHVNTLRRSGPSEKAGKNITNVCAPDPALLEEHQIS